jgi:hypothetical protein
MRHGILVYSFLTVLLVATITQTMQAATGSGDSPSVMCVERYPKSGMMLDPEKVFDPVQGTAEFWFKLDFEPQTIKNNQFLMFVKFDDQNSVGLYFNAAEKALVFFMRDKDDQRPDFHSRDYPVLINSGKLDWQKGQEYHVAVTWSPAVSRMYIDGKEYRRSFFHGGINVDVAACKERFLRIGAGKFEVQAARFWSQPRAPRSIGHLPGPDESDHLVFPTQTPAWPEALSVLKAGRLEIATGENQIPSALTVNGHQHNWMAQPLQIRVDQSLKTSWSIKPSTDGQTLVATLTIDNPTDALVRSDVSMVWPILQPDMKVFCAIGGAPFDIETGRKFYDHARDAQPVLPFVTVYQEEADCGLTISASDQTAEAFEIDAACKGIATDLRITHASIELASGQSRSITWHLVGHAGDWRAGLQAYSQLYPAILNPPVGPIANGHQGMIIGGPSDDVFLEKLTNHHIGWREVSLHLGEGAGFGNYIPDDLKPYEQKVASFYQANENMKRHGIVPMMYIQARECKNVERALAEFGESVVRYQDGTPVVDMHGPFGATMTCKPGSAWFEHLKDQAYREMKVFDNAGGFFFDNAWETEYAPIMNAIAELAHGMGKSLASNGANAMSIGSSDSFMAETHYHALQRLQYLGLVTPVTYVPIYATGVIGQKEREMIAPGLPQNLVVDMRYCLTSGAFYSFNYRGSRYRPEESLAMYQRYLPMQDLLVGRKWLLHAHALQIPEPVEGNIFERPNGNWVVTMSPEHDAPLGTITKLNQPVTIMLDSDHKQFESVLYRDLKSNDWQTLKMSVQGRIVKIEVPDFTDVAVLELIQK